MASAVSRGVGVPTPVIGRHSVVEELLAVFQRTRSGTEGKAVLLLGQGGVGKTTVLRAAAEMGRNLEFVVLEGRSTSTELPEPFQVVRGLVRTVQTVREARDRDASEPSPSLPIFLAPYESDVTGAAARATGLAERPRDVEEADRLLDHLANPLERVDANRRALFGRLSEFFTRLADERPVVLLIDDLHFADDSSLEFVKEFLSSVADHRVLLLASTVPVTEAPVRSRPALEAIQGHSGVATVEIPPMTEAELAEYVRWLLRGHDPGRDLVMRWFTQTEGNPLFTEYLVRASTGLSRDPASLPPEGVQDFEELLKARIRELPEVERRVLVYGSVLGREFPFGLLAAAAGDEEERMSESVDHLVHGGLLREKGDEVYEFVSERARVDVYSQLTETRRRLLHRRVAAALEKRADPKAAETFELARQFYLGRDDRKASEYNRKAAELSARAFAFDTAAVHLERALESLRRLTPRDLPQEILLQIELGRYSDELGDLRRSEEVLLDAVARARLDPSRETELAFALLGLAQTRSDLTQYVSCRELASEAFQIFEKKGHARGLLAAHRVLGVAAWRMADLEGAERHQKEELALAESTGSSAELGHALIDLANTFTLQSPDRAKEAMALYERAAGIFARIGDPSAQARVLMNLALLLHYAQRSDEALAKMREALDAAERSRSRIWIGYCSLNLAQFHAERHDLPSARAALERSKGLLEPLGDQLAHQQLTMIGGMIAAEEQAYDEAERMFSEAARLASTLNLTAEAAEMEYRFADLEARRGRPEQARQRLERAHGAGIDRLRADLTPRVEELSRRLAGPT